VSRMSTITASARDQGIPKVQELISERKERLPCGSSQEITVMLPLHHRDTRYFSTSLKGVPVHPEMDERHSKLLHKPQRDVTDISMKSEVAGHGAPTTSVFQLTARDGVSRHCRTAHAVH
jgi:hypothetical protein